MNKYKVTVNWTVESTIEVEANNEEEAIDKAFDTELGDFPEPEYVDDSFEVMDAEEI